MTALFINFEKWISDPVFLPREFENPPLPRPPPKRDPPPNEGLLLPPPNLLPPPKDGLPELVGLLADEVAGLLENAGLLTGLCPPKDGLLEKAGLLVGATGLGLRLT